MCKINKIPSEIRKFFPEKRRSSIMEEFTKLLEKQNIDSRSLGGVKRDNCKLTNLQVFQILVLMPFFAIPGFSHYTESVLNRMFGDKNASFNALKGKVATVFVTEKGAKGIKPGKKFADGLISKEAANGQVVDYLYYFGNAKSAVPDNATLNEIAKAAKDKNADITITAYASPTGSPAYNARLCKQRAKNLENYLEAQGVAPPRIKIIPGGQTSKFGAEAYNRRADIVVNYGS